MSPGPGNSVQTAYTDFDCPCSALDNRSMVVMSYILFYFLLVNSCQFMQFHVTCCLQTRLLTNNMARKSITYWHCCCKPCPLFMRLVNLTYQLLHYIYIHFRTGFFLAMFSVSETPEDAIHFFEGAVTRMTILGSHVTGQIPSPKFRSRLYRRSLVSPGKFLLIRLWMLWYINQY